MPHAMITTTMVRIAVARLEFTPSIPILARIEVNAANTADKTANIIDAEAIAAMKSDVRVLNFARGGLIDDEALAKALVNGKVAAAGLDCVENENLQENSLARMSNVILTPHMGGSSNDLAAEMIPKIAEQIKNLEMTGTIGNVVNKEYLK